MSNQGKMRQIAICNSARTSPWRIRVLPVLPFRNCGERARARGRGRSQRGHGHKAPLRYEGEGERERQEGGVLHASYMDRGKVLVPFSIIL